MPCGTRCLLGVPHISNSHKSLPYPSSGWETTLSTLQALLCPGLCTQVEVTLGLSSRNRRWLKELLHHLSKQRTGPRWLIPQVKVKIEQKQMDYQYVTFKNNDTYKATTSPLSKPVNISTCVQPSGRASDPFSHWHRVYFNSDSILFTYTVVLEQSVFKG